MKTKMNMNMKKLLCLGLTLIMGLCAMCGSACALEAPIASDTTMSDMNAVSPRYVLYRQSVSSTSGTWDSSIIPARSGSGNYIRFWFNNTTSEYVTVYLYRIDLGADRIVDQMTVAGNAQNSEVYFQRSAESGRYFLRIEATQSGGAIRGTVSVAQYVEL